MICNESYKTNDYVTIFVQINSFLAFKKGQSVIIVRYEHKQTLNFQDIVFHDFKSKPN